MPKVSVMVIFIIFAMAGQSLSKDFGTLGGTFPIREPDLLTEINKSILNDPAKASLLTTEFQKRVRQSINTPPPLSLKKVTQARTRTYDPSFEVAQDLKDHQGRLFAKQGDKINPLSLKSLSKPILLFDGRDEDQLSWALSQEETAILILTGGAPLELAERHRSKLGLRSFYFDQKGVICQKLGIEKVPSKITQRGEVLKIEEVALPKRTKGGMPN